MGVQLWIEGNHEYCKAHDLVEHDTFPCQCMDHGIQNCTDCHGDGVVTQDVYPWSTHYCYSTWENILQTIGLDVQDVVAGEMEGYLLLSDLIENGKHIPYHYQNRLFQIASEATRRKKKVFWS